jgi:1A family penicillin-binding protein
MPKSKKTITLHPGGGVIFSHKNPKLNQIKHLFELLGTPLLRLSVLLLKTAIKSTKQFKTALKDRRKKLFLIKKPRQSHSNKKSSKKTKTKKTSLLSLKRLIVYLNTFLLLGFCALLITFYLLVLKDLPEPKSLATQVVQLSTKIYDRNGQLLYKIYENQNRTLVKLPEIPQTLKNATLSIEDKNFYNHPGISLRGIARAVYRNLFRGAKAGGSTITQQLVKNVFLSSERSYQRKLKEIVLAVKVEREFTKDQILEMYFNQVGYGGTAYGVEEASRLYFGKSVKDLNLSESALLAGLPASPTVYSPFGAHPEYALERKQEVLRLMYQNKFITYQEFQEALKTEITYATPQIDIKAPHFVMYVKNILAQKYGHEAVERGGMEVHTTLDLGIQESAQQIVGNELETLAPLRISNGAALITNPKTGEILAMVGSKDYFDINHQGNFNVTTAARQPGSAIKPIMYSLALENGYTPATLIEDSPITYKSVGSPPYTPKNYDNRYHGKVTLRTALASSYNIPAVKTLASLGVDKLVEKGRNLGLTTWINPQNYGLSLTLGGGEVKMTDLATAYGTIANLGEKVELNPILKVVDHKGRTLEENFCATNPNDLCTNEIVINPGVAYQLIDILSDNTARAPAFGTRSTLVIPDKSVAVKTGTTNNLKDNWTVGFTSEFLVATWVGNNDNSPMSYVASGITGASPIWQKIMFSLIKDRPNLPYSPPEGIIATEICTLTNSKSCNECPSKRIEYFIRGTEPLHACSAPQITKIKEALHP